MSDVITIFTDMRIEGARRPTASTLLGFRDGRSSRKERRAITVAVRDAAVTVEFDRMAATEFETELIVGPDTRFLGSVLDATSGHLRSGSRIDCSTGRRWAYCEICRVHAIACRAFRVVSAIDDIRERRGKIVALILVGVALCLGSLHLPKRLFRMQQ